MAEKNPTARLEAFCDGVFAIAMTLLIIDIKIPAAESITSTTELWRALRHLAPSAFAFLLSFTIILITWVNHHAAMKMVARPSPAFIYANGVMLLVIVFVPFPTSLLGTSLLTDHAAPAVVLYDAVLAAQSIAWMLFCITGLRDHVAKDTHAVATAKLNLRRSYGAFAMYASLSVAAFWFPLTVAIITTLTWVVWLTIGVRMKATADGA